MTIDRKSLTVPIFIFTQGTVGIGSLSVGGVILHEQRSNVGCVQKKIMMRAFFHTSRFLVFPGKRERL
jgi:hypothetical protein